MKSSFRNKLASLLVLSLGAGCTNAPVTYTTDQARMESLVELSEVYRDSFEDILTEADNTFDCSKSKNPEDKANFAKQVYVQLYGHLENGEIVIGECGGNGEEDYAACFNGSVIKVDEDFLFNEDDYLSNLHVARRLLHEATHSYCSRGESGHSETMEASVPGGDEVMVDQAMLEQDVAYQVTAATKPIESILSYFEIVAKNKADSLTGRVNHGRGSVAFAVDKFYTDLHRSDISVKYKEVVGSLGDERYAPFTGLGLETYEMGDIIRDSESAFPYLENVLDKNCEDNFGAYECNKWLKINLDE